MKRGMQILVFLILAGSLFQGVLACSCAGGWGPACQEAWGKYVSAIFLGRVTKIEIDIGTAGGAKIVGATLGTTKRVTIEIEESYRGVTAKSVQVLTAANEAACGYSFKEGERYLVFAGGKAGQLAVSLCSATKPAQQAQEDIAYLRALPTMPEGARVYGTLKRYTHDPNFKPSFEPSIMDHYRPPEETYRAMAPMKGTRVRVKAIDGFHDALVDLDGKWAADGIPPGEYRIEVELPKTMVLLPTFGLAGNLSAKGCSSVDLRAESNGRFRGRILSEIPLSQFYLIQVGVFRAFDTEIDLIRPFSEVFPDPESGDFEIGPLPPGKYYLAVILDNKDLDVAAIFYPGVEKLEQARILTLGDGELKTQMNFKIAKPVFRKRPTCCEFKVRTPKRN